MDNWVGIQSDLDSTVLENAAELAAFMDIEYGLEVRIGEAVLTLKEILQLKLGDTIKINRRSSENALLSIENTVIGEAEVFPTKSGSGVRIIEIAQ
jgi:flagellar motor switch/type III secretory pathway protein FliN